MIPHYDPSRRGVCQSQKLLEVGGGFVVFYSTVRDSTIIGARRTREQVWRSYLRVFSDIIVRAICGCCQIRLELSSIARHVLVQAYSFRN